MPLVNLNTKDIFLKGKNQDWVYKKIYARKLSMLANFLTIRGMDMVNLLI